MTAVTKLELCTVSVRKDGCYSVLKWYGNDRDDGRPFAVSVERTFDDGLPVIRAGMYLCKRSYYHKGGYPTFEIVVSGHDRVLFHKGNVETQSEACVLVAESFGVLDGQTAVLDSKGGFSELMQITEGFDEFYMVVSGRRG